MDAARSSNTSEQTYNPKWFNLSEYYHFGY